MAKLVTKGNQQIRMTNPHGAAISAAIDNTLPTFSTSVDSAAEATKPLAAATQHLYADSNVPCFFRRPSFSPDGSLLITPTGVSGTSSSSTATEDASSSPGPSFCTHLFLRDHLQSPIVSLVGLEEPSVGVRCCPLLYELVSHDHDTGGNSEGVSGDVKMSQPKSLFGGEYRYVEASLLLLLD